VNAANAIHVNAVIAVMNAIAKMKKNKFEELAAGFKNEAEAEEEFDEEDIDLNKSEEEHYEEE